ncbi:10115_t:CDS:2 [Ambispora gerdemannii]|uniref:10115_t:CDS:1 n=1 Tax=Ambispora gerdemannii TaxID=144530 RepID=A0A9N8YYJ7_9GLOM|nr:10115_t:CDS:2 [Ambispora gerdemannii]
MKCIKVVALMLICVILFGNLIISNNAFGFGDVTNVGGDIATTLVSDAKEATSIGAGVATTITSVIPEVTSYAVSVFNGVTSTVVSVQSGITSTIVSFFTASTTPTNASKPTTNSANIMFVGETHAYFASIGGFIVVLAGCFF